ncbi:hypothetical protein [Alteromonas confluentis]|nr:hypothetical protein [Alteromonas confluentis]
MKATLFKKMDNAEYIQHFYDIFHSEYAKKVKKKYKLNHYPFVEKRNHGVNSYQLPIGNSTFDLSTYNYHHSFVEQILLNYYVIDVALILFKNSQGQTLSKAQVSACQEVARAFIKSAIEFSADVAVNFGCNTRIGTRNVCLPQTLWTNNNLLGILSIQQFYSEVCKPSRIKKHMRISVIRYMKRHNLINQKFEVEDQKQFVSHMRRIGAGALDELEKLATEFIENDRPLSDGLNPILNLLIFNTPKRRFRKVIKTYGQ